ncbi:MAG: hypothetical protein IJI88_04815 [Atopobiaceae bacterium]|nr:hypothetical protein [Atopobiaceae bacterium]
MRKQVVLAAALVLALSSCGGSQPAQEPEQDAATEEAATEEAVEQETEKPADQGPTIDWIQATSAEEAATGAGFERFGVLDKFVIGDLEFASPTFSYAGGVAQAWYETGASAVYLRKAEGYYDTPISDRALDEFGAKWMMNCSGVEVTCYGPARGAVTVATWTDGITTYGITFQGLGGEEMSMDGDELETIVKGVSEANVDQKAEEKKEEQQAEQQQAEEKKQEEQAAQQSSTKSSLPTDMEADAMVEKASGGSCISVDKVTTRQYGECWYCVAVDKSGTRYEYYVDKDGAHLIGKKEASSSGQQSGQGTSGGHYEGEDVTIFGSIYAEWHQANGEWYATFVTYNGTQIFAQPAPAGGGWKFNANVNGTSGQVFYSDKESSTEGKVGPAGVSSHWVSEDGKTWY